MSTQTFYEDGKLTVVRVFNSPREAVFDAWIKTSKVELWWGCAYADKVKSSVEPKVGGKFDHQMDLKGAGDYLHRGLITAYDPPALLAYQMTDSLDGEPMQVQVEFAAEGGCTRVTLTQTNLIDEHSPYVREGWSAAFEKLAELLLDEQFAKIGD